jgi:hypothetical protein
MEAFIIIVVLAIIGAIVSAVRSSSQPDYIPQSTDIFEAARALQRKFQSLGDMRGKTFAEIAAVAGQPNSISAAADGKVLRQWQRTGYHIALLFKDDVCEGITHEYVAP